jgi:hypothetical protein
MRRWPARRHGLETQEARLLQKQRNGADSLILKYKYIFIFLLMCAS